MTAVLSESVAGTKMVQNGPNDHFGQNGPFSELDLSLRETKMDHFGPFWPGEVHFGPFRSANRTLAITEILVFIESR